MSKDDTVTDNVNSLFMSLRVGSNLLVSHYKVAECCLTKFGERVRVFGTTHQNLGTAYKD